MFLSRKQNYFLSSGMFLIVLVWFNEIMPTSAGRNCGNVSSSNPATPGITAQASKSVRCEEKVFRLIRCDFDPCHCPAEGPANVKNGGQFSIYFCKIFGIPSIGYHWNCITFYIHIHVYNYYNKHYNINYIIHLITSYRTLLNEFF